MNASPASGLLVDQLRTMVRIAPGEPGFVDLDSGRGLTFAEWNAESNRLARGLVAAGVGKGERVALHVPGEESLRFVVAYAAIHKAGAVAVPANTRLTGSELSRILAHAGVTAAVTSPGLADAFGAARTGVDSLRVVVATGDGVDGTIPWAEALDDDDSDVQVPVGDDDLADIMYTSGTTGAPKGVAVSHGNVAMVPNTEPEWTGRAWIHSSPLFTFAGIGFVYNPMKMGLTSLYQARFDAGAWLAAVEGHRPRFAFVVPAMARLVVEHPAFETTDLSSLQLVSVGSAPLPFDVLRRFQERLPGASVSNSYGMTEAGAAYCVMPPGESLKRKGSVGMPLPPAEIRIVGESGAEVGPGEEGELLIRTPGKPRSYFEDDEATKAVWEPDGWLHTGDVAKLDADGYLYIVGRIKDVIIRGGHNVHAADVESVLDEHPDVREAAVFGVHHDVLGEDIAAAVVVREGRELTAGEVVDFCKERLADYKVPREVVFLRELPRNATGKVVKRALQEEVSKGD